MNCCIRDLSSLAVSTQEAVFSFTSFNDIFDFNIERASKICLIALAAFAVCTIELSCPPLVGVSAAVGSGVLTWIFEKYVREGSDLQSSWFDLTRIDQKKLISNLFIGIVVVPVLGAVFCEAWPVTATVVAIRAGNIPIIISEALIKPLAFELLFRGFVQERAEDLLFLTQTDLSIEDVKTKANYIQAIASAIFKTMSIEFGMSHVGAVCYFLGKSFASFSSGAKKNQESIITNAISSTAMGIGVTIGKFSGFGFPSSLI